MGRASRRKPERLAEKLLTIRRAFGLSQAEMVNRLGCGEELTANHISKFELGKNEPSLTVLLKYADEAGVWVDVLINDNLNLPARLPCAQKHAGIKRAAGRRAGQRLS